MAETLSTPPPRRLRRNRPEPDDARRPSLLTALVVTLLTTAPLLGILYLGAQLLRLPFTPFDLFDWPVRAGFAPWAQFIAEWNAAQSAGGNVAQSAPLVQWVLSIALFMVLAVVVGLAFYAFVMRRGRVPDLVDGLTAGTLLAVPMIFASLSVASSPLPPVMIVLWLGALFAVWGVVLSYAFGRLMIPGEVRPAADAAIADDPTAAAPTGGIDRRRFLLQFGASTAAVTAFSAAAGAALSRRQDAVALQRTLPMINPEFRAAQSELFGGFRRFVIVRSPAGTVETSNVLALGAEYPDRNYVSIWLGGHSPIVIYENIQTALAAYSTDDAPAGLFWLDE